jgi:hypothetical protein
MSRGPGPHVPVSGQDHKVPERFIRSLDGAGNSARLSCSSIHKGIGTKVESKFMQLCHCKVSGGFVSPHRERLAVKNIVKNIQKRRGPVWLALGCLLCANVASANTIGDALGQDFSLPDDGTGSMPPSDLEGWFFRLDQQPPFPSVSDPSQPWTSAQNIAMLNYWLRLVMDLGDNPSLLLGLDGLGMTDSPASSTAVSQQSPGNVPEPLTLGLLGGGLVCLGFYAARRSRRIRRADIGP